MESLKNLNTVIHHYTKIVTELGGNTIVNLELLSELISITEAYENGIKIFGKDDAHQSLIDYLHGEIESKQDQIDQI